MRFPPRYARRPPLNASVGRRGDRDLAAHPNPPEEQARHRVEEEFINAIRGLDQVKPNTFEIGVRYTEWTEISLTRAKSPSATRGINVLNVGQRGHECNRARRQRRGQRKHGG